MSSPLRLHETTPRATDTGSGYDAPQSGLRTDRIDVANPSRDAAPPECAKD